MKSSWRILITWMLIVAMVGTMVHISVTAQAETDSSGFWSVPQIITASDEAGINANISVDTTGVIHVIYEETSDLTVGRLRYTNNRPGSFAPGPVISGSYSVIELSAIDTVTLNGQVQVHAIFSGRVVGQNNSFNRVYYVFSPDGGTTWTAPVNIIGERGGYQPALVVDELGHAHVAFNAFSTPDNLNALAVYYVTNKTGAWSAPEKAGERVFENSYNAFPALSTSFVNNVVTVHMFFMGQEIGGGQLGKWVFSTRKVGDAAWTTPEVRGDNSSDLPDVTSAGNFVYAVWQGGVPGSTATDIDIYYVFSADNGITWSAKEKIGPNQPTQSVLPAIARASDGSITAIWDDQFNAVDSRQDIWANYSNNGLIWQGAAPVYQAVGFSKDPDIAGSCEYFHAVWHDSNQNNVFKIFFSQTGPTVTAECDIPPPPTATPTLTPTPTPPPVDAVKFTLTRTNQSPSKTPTISASLTNIEGSPNEVRYSTSQFAATSTTVSWQAFTDTVSANFTASPGICSYNLYVQARNTQTGQISAVQSINTVVDTGMQAGVAIYSIESLPNRPDSGNSVDNIVQPNAPPAGNNVYTRFSFMYYGISQEPAPCVGIKAHTAEGQTPASPTYPYENFVPFRTFSSVSDSTGNGYNEQQLVTTVVVTDQLDNVRTVTRTLYYDDDPPVLADGGTMTVTEGLSPEFALVSVSFNATITDDSYSTYVGLPNAGYWGAWVIASNSATVPTPAEFEQYGSIRQLVPGTTNINHIPLTNNLNAQMTQPGPRYIHVRFLDGAGNYTEATLTSPEVNLARIEFPKTFLPMTRN